MFSHYMPCLFLCFDYSSTMKRINQETSLPSSQYGIQLTSACSPDYVKPLNEGIKYGSYMRVIMRRRSRCQ